MAGNKTKPTEQSVEEFLAQLDEGRRHDCLEIVELMREATGEGPRMWGPGMVGFGSYHYRYDSGREGDFFLTGFSPRKRNLTLYLNCYFDPEDALLNRLGKFRSGKACLYVNRLADIDKDVLRKLVERSVEELRQKYG